MTPVETGAVVLQSGYREQARNRPNLPVLMTIAAPQVGHVPLGMSSGSTTWILPFSRLNSRVFLQSG
ncbi:hypothetical protein D3C83_306560 [compost metagenome]